MSTPRRGRRLEAVDEREAVTPLELFFDLVFVFALTQVTEFMAEEARAVDVLRGVLAIAVLWWCWIGYSWLCSLLRAEQGLMRLGLFAAMAAMFVQAITIPEAFDDLPGGLHGPMVFACCYFVVRAVHIALFWLASREDEQLRGQILRFLPSMLAGTILLLIASQTSGTTQTVLWFAALAGDYLGTLAAGSKWRMGSAAHYAERYGLIIIVALGESIVAIGVGVAHLPISWPIIAASVLGLVVSGALWWAYFDITALITERALVAADGERQVRLARGGYTMLHLPMVAGIVLMALGLKKVLGYVGGEEGHTVADPIYGIPLAALYGGAALYLLGHVGFTRYVAGSLNIERLVVVVLLLALLPVVAMLPALVTLAVLAVVLAALIGYETFRHAEQRREVRGAAHDH
ncbi:low temperature requirement protein A [Pseudonocardia cypriaca]|uniref:Low temperature requirement protein LtrA n=1 Tax=Pseudonocardia cypriaca TaxID=882449 RepID=A0A543FNY9_9PSEU|nr:low temperature requirement protein A [Pseudonocardia cypriaca]TQM35573.1 low temperature requirement protein LtrA [Pseudonocardia cypriaca]